MYVIPILLFAVILLYLFRPQKRVKALEKSVEQPVTKAHTEPLTERARIGARWLELMNEHYELGENIDTAKATALALDIGSGGDYGDLAKEKRIILEQIRIAGSSHDEVKRHLFEERSWYTLEATKWPFTAARLQLKFAQARLAAWPAIAP